MIRRMLTRRHFLTASSAALTTRAASFAGHAWVWLPSSVLGVATADARADLPRVTCPTLLVPAAHDLLLPLPLAEEVAALIVFLASDNAVTAIKRSIGWACAVVFSSGSGWVCSCGAGAGFFTMDSSALRLVSIKMSEQRAQHLARA